MGACWSVVVSDLIAGLEGAIEREGEEGDPPGGPLAVFELTACSTLRPRLSDPADETELRPHRSPRVAPRPASAPATSTHRDPRRLPAPGYPPD